VTRVVLFSYGPMIGRLRSFFGKVDATVAAVVLPSNRATPALAAAQAAAEGLDQLVQPPRPEIDGFAGRLRDLEPDLLLVWHYSMVLPPVVLQTPRLGSVNVHPGLLPEYRGAHVLQWAIVNGERETGVTLHYLDEGIDTGPVIAEQRVPITEDDDAASLAAALQDAGLELMRRHWHAMSSGSAKASPQPGGGRYWPLRTPADGVIDWTQPAVRIRDLVRALVPPWPGATFRLDGDEVVVDRAEVVDGTGEPGTVLSVEDDRVVVAAGEGAVAIVALRGEDGAVAPSHLGLRAGDRIL
jgi:methionyl-tRNA formyltransferase